MEYTTINELVETAKENGISVGEAVLKDQAAGKVYGTHLSESDCISDYSIFYQWTADLCDNESVPGLTYGQNHDRRYHVIDTGTDVY